MPCGDVDGESVALLGSAGSKPDRWAPIKYLYPTPPARHPCARIGAPPALALAARFASLPRTGVHQVCGGPALTACRALWRAHVPGVVGRRRCRRLGLAVRTRASVVVAPLPASARSVSLFMVDRRSCSSLNAVRAAALYKVSVGEKRRRLTPLPAVEYSSPGGQSRMTNYFLLDRAV